MKTPTIHFETRTACPACASVKFRRIYQSNYDEPPVRDYVKDMHSRIGKVEFEYLEGATYALCECATCGMIFQRHIPNETLMERLYGHWVDPERTFSELLEQGLGWYSCYAQEIMQTISYFRKVPSSLSFFDFGMGWGKWALMVKAFGCDSYGTELCVKQTEYAKSNGIKIVAWDEIPQYRFDFINAEQVFEHISEPLRTLRHLKKALKTKGILKISVPTANDIDRRLKIMDWKSPLYSKNSLLAVAPLWHINFFRRSSLVKMAQEAGMEEVFIGIRSQYRYTTDWGERKRIAKNVLLPIYRNILKRQNYVFLRSCNT